MKHPLVVGAVVESMEPATWIADLAHKLVQDPAFQLIVVKIEVATAQASTTAAPGRRRRLAHWIVSNCIDKPLFERFAVQATPLNAEILESPASMLQSCDVILNLSRSGLPAHWLECSDKPAVWCAHEETLNERVMDFLLTKAPLMWMHIWSEASNDRPAQRIASHSLPRQTYSLSDLQRTARFCLPTLFSSRLRWLANQTDLIAQETGLQADVAASVMAERQAMELQASELITNHFRPPEKHGAYLLLNVVQLWWQQGVDLVRNRFWYEQWQLAVFRHETTDVSLLDQMSLTSIDDYSSLPTPDKTWWADPHLCQYEGAIYLFFEEMEVGGSHGHLSVGHLQEDGQLSDIHHVMDQQSHLSYPFVFTHQDAIYMLPETASRKNVTLYKTEQFPDRWQPVKELLTDVDLADTTLHFHNHCWWMFTNSMSHRSVDERDELHIYCAEHLEGPWIAHPMNPVLTGVDRVRMAGPIFVENGQPYRVSQYGALRYGYGVNINRIDTLSTTEYRETPVRRVVPEPGSAWLGCHSMTHLNGFTVLDRMTRRQRF